MCSYPSVLSDHPCASSGPPVGLSWRFTEARRLLPPLARGKLHAPAPLGWTDAAAPECRRLATGATVFGSSEHGQRTPVYLLPPAERLERCLASGATAKEVSENDESFECRRCGPAIWWTLIPVS